MEYVYSALLLHTAGKPVDEAGVKKILEAAGIKSDQARVKALTASLKDVDIDEVIKGASLVPTTPQAPAAEAKEETKEKKEKEEKKEEEEEVSEEEAAAGLGALFG
ncbi:MAG TPA: 50S ribosomal protein P1 [Thermoplasmata archaeon]|nr:50S ribosomal protein P1 [Thermoplasmata archaeon]